jgi:hypothetical protein
VAYAARDIMHQNTVSLTVKPVILQENARLIQSEPSKVSYLASLVAVWGTLVIATKMHNNDGKNGAPKCCQI